MVRQMQLFIICKSGVRIECKRNEKCAHAFSIIAENY